ncbi:MAG: right-handed parallel beta-helix repeat-containing protein [Saprospiraceae bacterium]|nr:right-handed parallel beta-helix repeat-containing protein [Saprospiraceae bacterium]
MRSIPTLYRTILLYALMFQACTPTDDRAEITWKNIEKGLQEALITVKKGDTIKLSSGHFWFTRSLMMDDKSDVVIMGQGIDKTILSFRGQQEGAEGIKISNCKNIQLIGFTVEDAKGDNIKVTDTDGILFSKVKVYWTGGAKASNGAYGLYPVLCKRVVIEDCVAARASDAGIYVGQSDSVIIRRNTVFENVAGIESENSNFVDIYDNHTYDNTGGILVFDLPGLTQYGHHTRVHNNKVISNNHTNFAPKGNIVGMVPPGTGIMLLATRDAERFLTIKSPTTELVLQQ